MTPCVGAAEVVCGTCTDVTDRTDVTGRAVVVGKVDGAPEGVLLGVNKSSGDMTRAAVYSLDGDSDLTIAKGGSGSPLAGVSSSGK